MIFQLSEEPRLTLKEYCETTGLTQKQVRDLMNAKLLLPQKKNRFDNEEVTIGLFFAWGIREGIDITLEDLEYFYREAERVVNLNVELSIKAARDMPFEKAAEVKMQMLNSFTSIQNYLRRRIFKRRVSTPEHVRRSFTDDRLWRKKEDS
jgi:hypothetical protein